MKISEPKFLLKEPKSDKKTPVNLIVRFNNERLVYSTGETIHPNNWNFEDQRAVLSKKYPEHTQMNFWFGKLEFEVKDVFRNLKIEGITPTVDEVKNLLTIRLNDKPVIQKQDLFSFIEKYIEDASRIKKNTTIKVYNTVFSKLKEYSVLKKTKLNFNNIDLEFYSFYTQYMTMNLNYAQNTIAKHIRTLKVFLNAATEAGDNKNLIFRSKKFRKPTEDVTKIYLTESEIDKIYHLDLSENNRLEKVRDAFIVGCYTGLRFSDFTELKTENIQQDLIKIKTKKTGETVFIPFRGRLIEIYKKYNNNFPASISNQKMNEYLKEIAELAGVDDTVVISKMLGGERKDQVYKKHELVTTHCARRSFATNAYLSKIPAINIMKITGHKTEKVFMGYIRFSQEENANALKNHPFFN